MGFIANRSLWGLQNLGVVPSRRVSVAFAVLQQLFKNVCMNVKYFPTWLFITAVIPNCVGLTQMLRLTRPYVYPPL